MKKLIYSLIAMLTALSVSAYDFSAPNGDGVTIYYNINPLHSTVEVTEGDSHYCGVVNIPSQVSYNGNEYTVTKIGNWAFSESNDMTAVTISASVVTIGKGAFMCCKGLTSVAIPSSVVTIEDKAFWVCSNLTGIDIPDSVTTIGDDAFGYCFGLTSVSLGKSLTAIPDDAFRSCDKLTSLTIPGSVTSIGRGAFEHCTELTSIVIPNSVTALAEHAFANCYSLSSLTIGNSVATIGRYAFQGCFSLTSISIPHSVTTIEDGAFQFASHLQSVTIGHSVDYIGEDAFLDCHSIRTVINYSKLDLERGSEAHGKVALYAREVIKGELAGAVLLSQNTLELTIGQATSLTAIVIPADTTNKTVYWKSSDEKVATVDGAGRIVAHGVGTAIITASCDLVTATCEVTVLPIPAEEVLLDKTEVKLLLGSSVTLTATVRPEATTDKTVVWTSSDPAVATVDSEGRVEARGVGTAKITATCGNVSATCEVTVSPILAKSVALDKTEIELPLGSSVTLTATVQPEATTDKTVVWTSSDPAVATVDKDGKVEARGLGTAKITATCDNVSATCEVTVSPIPARAVSIDKNEIELPLGQSVTLSALVQPYDTTDKTIVWTSSDPAVATVDSEGRVEARALGTAIITATCGDASFSCEVTVVPILAEYVLIDLTSLDLRKGEHILLTATVFPEDTTDKTVVWTSSDQAVATVDSEGCVLAVGPGTATITATCGDASASCQITVFEEAGIDTISADPNAAAEYFTLQGVRIMNPAPGTFVIRRIAGKTEKVLVK